jgi:diguanylate cyclase (GGDEF)-like protein
MSPSEKSPAVVKALDDILAGRRPEVSSFDEELAAALERIADKLEYLSREIADLSPSDEVTSLVKEEVFNNVLWREFNRALRYGKPMSMALVEIDGFDELRAEQGTAAAMDLLQHIASIVLQMIRETDLAARYGDDRLAVIMPETAKQGALDLGHRLRKSVEEGVGGTQGDSGEVTVSVGISSVPSDRVKTAPDLVEQASAALDRAKQRGRSQVSD